LLEHTLQDIMNDYQRFTMEEAKKFDHKYGDLITQASRALYSTEDVSQINFRNIDVDLIFQLAQDLNMYLDERD